MKITNFDDTYTQKLGLGETTLVSGSSGGSNSGLGGDVSGSLGNVSVDGLRRSVSLGSNLGTGVAIGDTLTIISTAGTPIARFATPSNTGGGSFGSNATRVSETSFVGASANGSREDHRHDGIGTVTASSSNTMQRGTLNLRAGTNISFGLTDTDGSGTLDTVTVNSTVVATGGSSGGGTYGMDAAKYNPDHETPATTPAVQGEFNGTRSPFAWSPGGATPPTDDITTYPGYLYAGGGSGDYDLYAPWTPGASDCTIACKVLVSLTNQNTAGVLAVMLGATTSASAGFPTDGAFTVVFIRTSQIGTFAGYNRNSGSFSQVAAEANISQIGNNAIVPIWLRLVRVNSGPTWTFSISLNGLTWTAHATTGSKAVTVASAFLRISDASNTTAIDWIRCWNSVVTKVGA